MKKLLILLVFLAVGYGVSKKECREAYSNGYRVGWDTGIHNEVAGLGCNFVVSEEGKIWAGVGNEEYTEKLERMTGRNGGKYWWAE